MKQGKLRVLVVEDEYLLADYIGDVVEEAGHEVVGCAPSGEIAIEMLSHSQIDVAILDIKLKGEMTGIDVAQETHKRAIPHIFISGSGDPSTRAKADSTQPVGFLQKPFSDASLVALLASVLARTG